MNHNGMAKSRCMHVESASGRKVYLCTNIYRYTVYISAGFKARPNGDSDECIFFLSQGDRGSII